MLPNLISVHSRTRLLKSKSSAFSLGILGILARVCSRYLVLINAVMGIRIGCNADPDPGSATVSIRIRIKMRIWIQGVKNYCTCVRMSGRVFVV